MKSIILKILVLAAVIIGSLPMRAQTDMILSQHWAMPTLYNPARAGESDFLRLRGAARLQWVGIDNAPKNFAGCADAPFLIAGRKTGAGIIYSSESIGLFTNMLAAAQFTLRIPAPGGSLSFGLQGGYLNSRFRGSDTYVPDDDGYHKPDDPAIPTQDLSGNAVDFSIGLSYNFREWHAGASLSHIASPRISLDMEGSESNDSQHFETQLPRTLYFDFGGNITLKNTLFKLQPSALIATDFSSFAAEMSLRATYNNFISFGAAYRWNDAVSFMVGATYRNFFLGYAFDYPVTAIAKASSGSHELVAGYEIKLNLGGKNKNKHRSIRIM